jgi:IS5 family transposase
LAAALRSRHDVQKTLVIQTANPLPDERTEFLINDRLSFIRFLAFGLSDRVPNG